MKGFDSVNTGPGWQVGCEVALKMEAETTACRAGCADGHHGPCSDSLMPVIQTRVLQDKTRDKLVSR